MPKTKISEYSTTNSDNTDIESINIAEGCAPSGINNAIRELMVHLKEFQTGASGDAFTFAGGVLISGTANTITGNVLMSGTNTITGSTTATFAAGAVGTPSIAAHGDTNTGIFFPAADTIAFTEGGTEAARFDSSGRLLIGTTSGTRKLTVYENAAQVDVSIVSSTTGLSILQMGDTAADNQGQIVYRNSSDQMEINVNGNGSLVLNSSNNVQFVKNISIGNATPTTSGTGITFPATQSASTNANTLDDYEQGTFDATLTPGTSGTITVNSAYNRMAYTKIGRQVTITGLIIVSSVSSPVGTSVTLGNLPFPCSNIGEFASRSSAAVMFSDASLATNTVIPSQIIEAESQLRFYMTAANIAANDEFVFGLTYFAAD